jgi:type IV pilus biogenesis protein CpaD/CtpE
MKKVIIISVLAAILIGCANTKSTVSKAYMSDSKSKISLTINKEAGVSIPEGQYQLLESQIKEGLMTNGILASGKESAQHSVVVNLHAFRMRSDAARLTVGIFSGCDNVNSTVVVTDKSTGEKIGDSKISIKECAAWGVASQVIKKYTDGVVAYLINKKNK